MAKKKSDSVGLSVLNSALAETASGNNSVSVEDLLLVVTSRAENNYKSQLAALEQEAAKLKKSVAELDEGYQQRLLECANNQRQSDIETVSAVAGRPAMLIVEEKFASLKNLQRAMRDLPETDRQAMKDTYCIEGSVKFQTYLVEGASEQPGPGYSVGDLLGIARSASDFIYDYLTRFVLYQQYKPYRSMPKLLLFDKFCELNTCVKGTIAEYVDACQRLDTINKEIENFRKKINDIPDLERRSRALIVERRLLAIEGAEQALRTLCQSLGLGDVTPVVDSITE
jgi:hypothetical protein